MAQRGDMNKKRKLVRTKQYDFGRDLEIHVLVVSRSGPGTDTARIRTFQ